MAQEAAQGEIANSILRRLLSQNQLSECTYVKVGDSVLAHKAARRKSAPRWRGPAASLGIDENGVTVEFQGQFFEIARNCVRKQVEPRNGGRWNGIHSREAWMLWRG